MNTQIKKVTENAKLVKLLMINELSKVTAKGNEFAKKTFANELQKCTFYGKADENYKSNEVKEIFTEINVTFKNKYEYFTLQSGYKETSIKQFLRIAKLDNEVIENFLSVENCPTLDKLDKFVKDGKETETNLTKEGITERSETAKPKKVTTDKKHAEAKISEGADRNEVIELINKLMADYQITPAELIAVNSEIAMAC
jgi:hypothetical protein